MLGGTIAIDSDGKNMVTCEIKLPCNKLQKQMEGKSNYEHNAD